MPDVVAHLETALAGLMASQDMDREAWQRVPRASSSPSCLYKRCERDIDGSSVLPAYLMAAWKRAA